MNKGQRTPGPLTVRQFVVIALSVIALLASVRAQGAAPPPPPPDPLPQRDARHQPDPDAHHQPDPAHSHAGPL